MASSTPEATAVRCAYPGCENEPRAAEDVVGAKPEYCGQPDPLTGKPHGALTAFQRRQELRQRAAEAEDLGRPVTMATGWPLCAQRHPGRHSYAQRQAEPQSSRRRLPR